MSNSTKKNQNRVKRAYRVRNRLTVSPGVPRLSVTKTNKHIQANLIDGETGNTLLSVATFSKEFRGTEFAKKNKKTAAVIGGKIAERAKEKGISKVVFDRGASKYHGILKELADAARSNGLQF